MGLRAWAMDAGMHSGAIHATQVREDEAKAIARKYVDEQLKGYTIEQVTRASGGCERCTM